MQDKNHAPAKIILLSLANALNIKGIRGLASFLGVPDSTVYAWCKRGNIGDIGLIIDKCPTIRRDWLRTGEGPMFREPIQAQANIVAPVAKITAEATNQNFDVAGGMMITKKVLESGTGYANALWHNLKSFDAAVDREDEVGEMKEMMEKIMADNKLLLEKIAGIEKATVSPGAQKRDSAANA